MSALNQTLRSKLRVSGLGLTVRIKEFRVGDLRLWGLGLGAVDLEFQVRANRILLLDETLLLGCPGKHHTIYYAIRLGS